MNKHTIQEDENEVFRWLREFLDKEFPVEKNAHELSFPIQTKFWIILT